MQREITYTSFVWGTLHMCIVNVVNDINVCTVRIQQPSSQSSPAFVLLFVFRIIHEAVECCFYHSSTFVYYTECKSKNKKQKNGRGLGARLGLFCTQFHLHTPTNQTGGREDLEAGKHWRQGRPGGREALGTKQEQIYRLVDLRITLHGWMVPCPSLQKRMVVASS